MDLSETLEHRRKKVLALVINLIPLALKCQKTNEPDNTDVLYLKFLHIPEAVLSYAYNNILHILCT